MMALGDRAELDDAHGQPFFTFLAPERACRENGVTESVFPKFSHHEGKNTH
jgi:hypothetical protein